MRGFIDAVFSLFCPGLITSFGLFVQRVICVFVPANQPSYGVFFVATDVFNGGFWSKMLSDD